MEIVLATIAANVLTQFSKKLGLDPKVLVVAISVIAALIITLIGEATFEAWLLASGKIWLLAEGCYAGIYKKLKINPTTGMMSLNFLLKHTNFKSLTIYGFDFFATKTWYNTQIDSGQKHSGRKERALFMGMIKENPRVKFI